jgi:signal peptidase II
MILTKRLMVIVLVSLACVGCDQGTKSLANNYLPKNEVISYFYDTVRIGYTKNTGAFLGVGSLWSENTRFLLFTLLAGVFLTGLLIYLIYATIGPLLVVGLSLIFGGGSSNLYDRIANNGSVIDFMNLGVGVIRTGIFNVADMAILLGVFVVLISHLSYRADI